MPWFLRIVGGPSVLGLVATCSCSPGPLVTTNTRCNAGKVVMPTCGGLALILPQGLPNLICHFLLLYMLQCSGVYAGSAV